MKAAKTLLIAALSTLTLGSGYGGDLDKFPAIAAAETFSWLGYYSQQSERCTEPATNASCADQFRYQLKIKPWNQRYKVELLSTQADQHVCSFSFFMDVVDGELVHETELGRVLVRRNDVSLEITSKNIDPTALGLGVCGAHADIDGLTFPLASQCLHECDKPTQ